VVAAICSIDPFAKPLHEFQKYSLDFCLINLFRRTFGYYFIAICCLVEERENNKAILWIFRSLKHKVSRRGIQFVNWQWPRGVLRHGETCSSDRKTAQKVCFKWAEASEKARRKELTAAQSRNLLSELTLISSGEQLEFYSVEGSYAAYSAALLEQNMQAMHPSFPTG
jgi:hypothetical protein